MTARKRVAGFTIVELMTVMIIIGILAGIALLKYIDLRNTARAAEVAGAFRTVGLAAHNHYADSETWPADGTAGVTPPALVQYLPGGFNFTTPHYTLDYENLSIGGGFTMVGVTVASSNTELIKKLKQHLGTSAPYFALGGTLTYVIATEAP
ncbi:MAG TPA: prepilin-type N-terminal cleavage/methylation domain-containing protein [Gemmatimonadales bacterium]|nr:prepilin-type N-terminal cleavage/methylation domain-containing protein [Gemmatimonadales bacterium]